MPRPRLITFLALAIAAATTWFLFSDSTTRESWRRLPQHVGLGEHLGADQDTRKAATEEPDYVNWNPQPDFKPGKPMPPGHNYTSLLVIAKTKEENIDWVSQKMPNQAVAAYVVDDPNAPLHPPKNKGHEVMTYLTWIIDNYDHMPDVIMFMHAHEQAWHNDDLMDSSNYVMVSRLSLPHVWRNGFVNMKCNWSPGCPDWVHPANTEKDSGKEEEHVIAKSWAELFPLDEVPTVLSQPCCAQFALSRDRIQARPHAQYVWYRDWLFNTRLPDRVSGRVWEYIWQYVFTGQNVVCPKEFLCFCDQYGLCFGGEEGFEDFRALRHELGDREDDLHRWQDEKKQFEQAKQDGKKAEDGSTQDEMDQEVEQLDMGRGKEIQKEIDRVRSMVDKMRAEAEERGKDPKLRASDCGREWKEGDGF